MKALKIHPAANFLPDLNGSEFQELKADIKARGLREPILVKHGHIIDGRHRYKACIELGIEPGTEDYRGDDIIGEIASRNLFRRNLTAKERAEIAAKLIPQIKSDKIVSGPNEPESKRPAHRPNTGGRAVEKAAKIMRVSASSVKRAQQRLDQSPKKKPRPKLVRTFEQQVQAKFVRFLESWPVARADEVTQIVLKILKQ